MEDFFKRTMEVQVPIQEVQVPIQQGQVPIQQGQVPIQEVQIKNLQALEVIKILNFLQKVVNQKSNHRLNITIHLPNSNTTPF